MSSTARAAWIEAWEGGSTPSPSGYRSSTQQARDARYAREQARPRSQRYLERETPRGNVIRPAYETWAPRGGDQAGGQAVDRWRASMACPTGSESVAWPEETLGPVIRLSEARAREAARETARRERHEGHGSGRRAKARHWRGGAGSRQVARHEPRVPERLLVPDVAPIRDYDWEAAARRRPAGSECERVILHADRSVEARISSRRYYGREATARVSQPWPEAPRRQAAPRLRVVKRKVARRRLAVLAVAFGLLLIGCTVVAPMMTSAAVAGVEAAVGQAEAQQEQLAAEAAALSAQISSLSSPQRVAEEAALLGLAPAQEVSYVSPELSGGPALASEGDTALAGR
jgi:cell division protein FtsB